MSITAATYTKLANAAAKDLVERSVPLLDSVDKLAATHDMNPEQLQRLCEATNNAAFARHFEERGKQGSEDRLVEFDVVHAKDVLKRRVGAEKTAAYRTAASAFDAEWESRPLRMDSAPERVKQASEEVLEAPAVAVTEEKLRQALEYVDAEYKIAAYAVLDAVDTVTGTFRDMYSRDSFYTFEKEAMALYGDACEPVLNHMRTVYGMPDAERDFSKVANLVVINDKSEAHTRMRTALAAFEQLEKYANFGRAALRALGGAGIGGGIGAGFGALTSHLLGRDVASGARRGAVGGAGLGALAGGLSSFAPRGNLSSTLGDSFPKIVGTAAAGLGTSFGAHLMAGIGTGGGAATEQADREMGRHQARQQIMAEQAAQLAPQQAAAWLAAQRDDLISRADPELMQSSFDTMKNIAPTLSADPNAVKSFLREAATWGQPPSYATLKNLADAERAIVSTRSGGGGSF